jgi:site-specific recombinase XerD
MGYADRARAPRTLTRSEQARLLKVTGTSADTYRDHMLFALALGTGLRTLELVGLDVGDVRNKRGGARQRVDLRIFKRCTDDPSPQFVLLSDTLRKKIDRFFRWKRARGEQLEVSAPLFVARGGRRLSKRRARALFAAYRELCDLSPSLSFHALRHTFCQALYEQTEDIRLVQKAARHVNVQTSTRYAEPSDDQLLTAVNRLHP